MTASIAYIGLGSNVGDRLGYLRQALDRLHENDGVDVTAVSHVYETEPVGGPVDQGWFFNAVAQVSTTHQPMPLLATMHEVEATLDRVRTVKDGPRTIDLDLLLFGSEIRQDESLTLPHPRFAERAFVLVPMCDIAPDVRCPASSRSVRTLLGALPRVDGLQRTTDSDWWSPTD